MRLGPWMEVTGHNDRSLAVEIEKLLPPGERCTASGVRKWRFGERMPRLARMKAIQQLSNGKVTPNDFAEASLNPVPQPSNAGKAA